MNDSSNNITVSAFEKNVIYVYKHLDVLSHHGWLKVGRTKISNIRGDGHNLRIIDQHEASNVAYEVLYTTDAVTNDGHMFSDNDIHIELEKLGIEREQTINPLTNRKSEWFKTDISTIIETIENYKTKARVNSEGIIVDFTLRAEQKSAIDITTAYYERTQIDTNIQPDFLWNAKPRFGKTLTAYAFAQNIKARKILILTNRPAIADSWYTDFQKFDFKYTGQEDEKHRWEFTASASVRKRLKEIKGSDDILTRKEQKNRSYIYPNFIHFISLQDIKGTKKDADAYKRENEWIFKSDDGDGIKWDLLIIDESHEGVDTSSAYHVLSNVNHDFALHLSGTPFKALASNKFSSQQIYNWSYTDEQNAKITWNLEDGNNPYSPLPKLNIFTYQLSRALQLTLEEAKNEGSEYAFELAELFKVRKVDGVDTFAYQDKVKLFLDNLANPNYQYPFSKKEQIESLRHTFWLLPGVKQSKLMKQLLQQHPFFKDYTVILAAGDGDEDRLTNTALEEVRSAINGHNNELHPLETKTITLSCGQLTTGVTVPAWTAVLMLNSGKSPAVYMQTAFRAQNPFSVTTSGGEVYTKENCYIFDFAPDRILQTLAEMADKSSSDKTLSREAKIQEVINFIAVIAEDDEGRMLELDANQVLTLPLKLITEEVVTRGFMSNRLFENINNIFGAPQSVMDILNKMTPDEGGKQRDKDTNKVTNKPRIWVDKENKVHINEDIVINTTNGLLGEKQYVEIGSELAKEVDIIRTDVATELRNKNIPADTANVIMKELDKKLPKVVAKLPDPLPQPGDPDYHQPEEPDEKPAPKEKTEEEKVRDRLRGFSKTIPSFLMAYGDTQTTLSNFDTNIPEDVFQELTSITKEEFRKLRDGFEFEEKNEETGEIEHRQFQGLFNESVFNSSVQVFLDKKAELADYYLVDHTEDIFEYIPPQSTNQIFTPKKVVKMMLDSLEENNPDIFKSTQNTFIDLYMKSGLYITAIAKRIFTNTRNQYNSDMECIKHILENQVYGLAPTGVLYAITNSLIFGFDDAHIISTKNFAQLDPIPYAKGDETQSLQDKLYEQFNLDKNMKFTAVVGNPPYQGDNHSQIYPFFYISACQIGDSVSLIFPTGWQDPKNANNLRLLNNKDIKEDPQIVFIDNKQNVFPGISGAEWTNIILWKRNYNNGLNGSQNILTNGKNPQIILLSTEKNHDNKPKEIIEMAKIVMAHANFISMQSTVSSLKPYGLRTDFLNNPLKYKLPNVYDSKNNHNDLTIYGLKNRSQTKKYIPLNYPVPKVTNAIDKYKVFIGKAWGNWSDNYLGGAYSDIVIASPSDICTENFLESGNFSDHTTAQKHAKYMMTKFLRALLFLNKHSQDNSKEKFNAIPIQDYSETWWDKSIKDIDLELMKKYNIPDKIRDFIFANIQEKTEANIVNYNNEEE
jgi:hypothetical protein